MDAENVKRGAVYVALGDDREALGFWIGGIHPPEQIPDDAVEIPQRLHRQWIAGSGRKRLNVEGTDLEDAPPRVIPMVDLRATAVSRATRAAEREIARRVPGGVAGALAALAAEPSGAVATGLVALHATLQSTFDAIRDAQDRDDLEALFPIDFGGA
jgi:hypothetical protein